jgi:hypothetical protein
MRKRTRSKKTPGDDDLRREYRFDYRLAKPNRFASRFATGSVAVVLEPDVASVFRTSDSVNALLRSVLAAIPPSVRRTATTRRRGSNRALQRTGANGKRGARR